MGDTHGETTAYEDLVNLLAEWLCTTKYGSREKARQILDKHAHELAEKQHAWLISEGYGPSEDTGDGTCPCESCTWCIAQDYIALIDPKTRGV